ncbi:RNA polymerase sigma-70 factor, sigma-E family [Streptomyces zhaozhouensis]|uniref:RNA polymerase sigma-70 factor, sigma-E family n=1 Tax=Streptomyces zhaozhouensis TaxID=1300267 RepID=A0A286DVB5_9ACTN|nr:SigE family RNA polymerase sigma factor [Streptomyces zhaozhouensis]SOD62563.1 RNA polymerase sigma-70 factor, sigma-E family [Streptomyces zhaozhouensis]
MRRRDEESFRQFAESRGPRLFRAACLMVGGDTHLAEDLVQETLGRMFTVWGRKRCIDNPDAYARKVLVRACVTHRRRRSSGEQPAAWLPDKPVEIGDFSLRVTLIQAIATLPPKDRAVVVMRYLEDLSIEQTAAALRTSSSAVRSRSSRALAKLRAELEQTGFAELTAV